MSAYTLHVKFKWSYREWTENGQLWVQQVSSTPATRLDVVNLQVRKPVISRASSCNQLH